MEREHIEPCILAFIGPSGVGKSTLLKLVQSNAESIKRTIPLIVATKYKCRPSEPLHDNNGSGGEKEVIVSSESELNQLIANQNIGRLNSIIGGFSYGHFRWRYHVDNSIFEDSEKNIVALALNDDGWNVAKEYLKENIFKTVTSVLLHCPPEDARARFQNRGYEGDVLEERMRIFKNDMRRYNGYFREYDMALSNESPLINPHVQISESEEELHKKNSIDRTIKRVEQGLRFGINKTNHQNYIDIIMKELVGNGIKEIQDRSIHGKKSIKIGKDIKERLIEIYKSRSAYQLPGDKIDELRRSIPDAIIGATIGYGIVSLFLNMPEGYDKIDRKADLIRIYESIVGISQSALPKRNFKDDSFFGLSYIEKTLCDDVCTFGLRDHYYGRFGGTESVDSLPIDKLAIIIVQTNRLNYMPAQNHRERQLEALREEVYADGASSVREFGIPKPLAG